MICGFDLLAEEYASMTMRAKMAEDHAKELQDLLCAFFVDQDKGAETFLREVAADWAEQFVARRSEGRAAA